MAVCGGNKLIREQAMTSTTDQKKIERFMTQYEKIVRRDNVPFTPARTTFTWPTVYRDDRPAITRTYAGV